MHLYYQSIVEKVLTIQVGCIYNSIVFKISVTVNLHCWSISDRLQSINYCNVPIGSGNNYLSLFSSGFFFFLKLRQSTVTCILDCCDQSRSLEYGTFEQNGHRRFNVINKSFLIIQSKIDRILSKSHTIKWSNVLINRQNYSLLLHLFFIFLRY